jgi:hypothetical protein
VRVACCIGTASSAVLQHSNGSRLFPTHPPPCTHTRTLNAGTLNAVAPLVLSGTQQCGMQTTAAERLGQAPAQAHGLSKCSSNLHTHVHARTRAQRVNHWHASAQDNKHSHTRTHTHTRNYTDSIGLVITRTSQGGGQASAPNSMHLTGFSQAQQQQLSRRTCACGGSVLPAAAAAAALSLGACW